MTYMRLVVVAMVLGRIDRPYSREQSGGTP